MDAIRLKDKRGGDDEDGLHCGGLFLGSVFGPAVSNEWDLYLWVDALGILSGALVPATDYRSIEMGLTFRGHNFCKRMDQISKVDRFCNVVVKAIG